MSLDEFYQEYLQKVQDHLDYLKELPDEELMEQLNLLIQGHDYLFREYNELSKIVEEGSFFERRKANKERGKIIGDLNHLIELYNRSGELLHERDLIVRNGLIIENAEEYLQQRRIERGESTAPVLQDNQNPEVIRSVYAYATGTFRSLGD